MIVIFALTAKLKTPTVTQDSTQVELLETIIVLEKCQYLLITRHAKSARSTLPLPSQSPAILTTQLHL